MSNRLAHETSPYLLQHANNPVDWHPWGPEALTKAVVEDKPILVSIGYSACHWCHVMERESFENVEIARLMNERFINIKVDREERPDVDAIYMEAVQAFTGSGGWPLNVFLTPHQQPFFGGTYFPPGTGRGLPSWKQVLESVSDAYHAQRNDVVHNAAILTQYLQSSQHLQSSDDELSDDLLRGAYAGTQQQFDWTFGGFGAAPKFPQPLALEFVLRMYARYGQEDAKRFLMLSAEKMAGGGTFDQLGGGFHRYSVDAQWLAPHFEKMLYDNALLARFYIHTFQAFKHTQHRRIVERTLDYLIREMRSPQGGYYSAEDADSEGVEGKFYLWTRQEVEEQLPPEEAEIFLAHYGIRSGGNFEGKTILTLAETPEDIAAREGIATEQVEQLLQQGRAKLLKVRSERVPPEKDTKILNSWNALAISALAEAGRVLARADYLAAATDAARFILTELQVDGRLVRSYKDGPGKVPGFLEDYAFLTEALLTLYETTFDVSYLGRAVSLAEEMIDLFRDQQSGAFFDVARDVDPLIVRPRSLFDNPIPSGNAAASSALQRLGAHTGNDRYLELALPAMRAGASLMKRAPLGFASLLSDVDFYLSSVLQVAIVADPHEEGESALIDAVFRDFVPNKVVSVGETNETELLRDRQRLNGLPTAYVCRDFACRLPVTTPAGLRAQLEQAR